MHRVPIPNVVKDWSTSSEVRFSDVIESKYDLNQIYIIFRLQRLALTAILMCLYLAGERTVILEVITVVLFDSPINSTMNVRLQIVENFPGTILGCC